MSTPSQTFAVSTNMFVDNVALPDETSTAYTVFYFDPPVSSINTDITYSFKDVLTSKPKSKVIFKK
ncbi:MAG: hypothetical protein Nk1A_8930 [Endomicrobiia bacterium]|nr:MAG: hypothetical protein Nk1A_8930 [Endomicrobiia bacterium]